MELTEETSGNKNKRIIKESTEIDDLVARIEPKLFHYILILRLSNIYKVDQKPRTDIVREIEPTCP